MKHGDTSEIKKTQAFPNKPKTPRRVQNKMKTLPLRIYRRAILLGVMMFSFGMFRFLPDPGQNGFFANQHFKSPNMCVWEEKDK